MLLTALVVVGAITLPIKQTPDTTPQPLSDQATTSQPTPKEFLKQEIQKQKLTDRDEIILTEIIQCESGWSQFWERDYNGHIKGEVKVSQGNIGLAQINYGAHHEEYERLGLDPYKEFDNLKYAVILYKRGGITAWKQWSGHCFLPALERKGIDL